MMLLEMVTLAELGLGAIAVLLALKNGATYARVVSDYYKLLSRLQRCERERQELKRELDRVYRLASFGKVLFDALKAGRIRVVPASEKCEHLEVVPGKIVCRRPDGRLVDLSSGEHVGESIAVMGEKS